MDALVDGERVVVVEAGEVEEWAFTPFAFRMATLL